MYSKNQRVQYTIDNCNLNRDALVQHRIAIVNDLKNNIKHLCKDKNMLRKILHNFALDSKGENKDFAFKKYIADNILFFLCFFYLRKRGEATFLY